MSEPTEVTTGTWGGRFPRAIWAALACVLAAAPHLWSGRDWYPAGVKDSLLYLFGASRLLASGTLVGGVADLRAWSYSGYSLLLALVSRLEGRHPMAAYPTLGYATALLLPAALGLFVYLVSRRFQAGILACLIAGLWGGLAGYLYFAQEGVPALLTGRPLPLIDTDYYDGRLLGEYAGHHSELVAYLCQAPSYPRTAGLVLFWPALALLYAGLPRVSLGRLLASSALILLATALYPYYGVTGLVVLLSVLFSQASSVGRRGALLLGLCVLIGVLALADFFVWRQSQIFHLPAYLSFLWNRPLKPDSWLPPLQFDPVRTLGGHVFMVAIALWGASFREAKGAEPRLPGLRAGSGWSGWVILGPSLVVCLAGGLLSAFSMRARMMLNAYGWIVPFRALVEPLVVLVAATGLETVVSSLASARRFALAALVVLVPCVSPLHWAVNSALFYRAHHRNREVYAAYLADGERLLGKVHLREPLILDGDVGETLYLGAALGVRAIPKWDDAARPFFEPGGSDRLLVAMREGLLGDVAVMRGGPLARELSGRSDVETVASFGRYDVLRTVAGGP